MIENSLYKVLVSSQANGQIAVKTFFADVQRHIESCLYSIKTCNVECLQLVSQDLFD
jgi:predicted GNAT superfamily acetyltransferase